MTIKLLIVGGVAGGATAAARARRLNEHADIILFERGGHISFANCGLPYYIGGSIKKRNSLFVTTAKDLKQRYRIDVREKSEVLFINKTTKEITVKNLITNDIYKETYDKLLLSPGAEPFIPSIKGIDLENIFTLRNIFDTDQIMAFVQSQKPKSALIVGGGFIGLEMAENLRKKNIQTTIIELLDQVMPPFDIEMASIIHEHLKEKKVNLELKNSVTQFSQLGNQIKVTTSMGQDIVTDMVIWAAGVKPESKLANDAQLETGLREAIKVNALMQTTDPDIFAVGDAIVKKDKLTKEDAFVPLAGSANREARVAADNIMGKSSTSKAVLGTSIVKIFNITAAMTGLNEKTLKKSKILYLKSYTFSGSHASYYPGSEIMGIKLMFAKETGKILGAQIVGGIGVDKRIDVLSTAIQAEMSVYDLQSLELSYAPPYSSAKDPVNIAGFVASNILKKEMEIIHWHDINKVKDSDTIFLDLRTKKEINREGSIENSINIPIDELRDKIKDLNKTKKYILFCAVGLRGYIGYKILVQNGFNVKNLSGGYQIYKYALSSDSV